jgi:hypothetical protein
VRDNFWGWSRAAPAPQDVGISRTSASPQARRRIATVQGLFLDEGNGKGLPIIKVLT